MKQVIFTIGHSTHPLQKLLHLLHQHSITAVADVRSVPYSRANTQFNRENLHEALRLERVAYVFLGRELGARTNEKRCYLNGKVQYDRLAQTELFRQGLERVKQGSNSYRLALLCAEKDPAYCHRAILVGRLLSQQGFAVSHVLADGSIESQEELVERLLRILQMPEKDMFRPREQILSEAYRRQAEVVAYQEEPVGKFA